jgi:hypothetical protein
LFHCKTPSAAVRRQQQSASATLAFLARASNSQGFGTVSLPMIMQWAVVMVVIVSRVPNSDRSIECLFVFARPKRLECARSIRFLCRPTAHAALNASLQNCAFKVLYWLPLCCCCFYYTIADTPTMDRFCEVVVGIFFF